MPADFADGIDNVRTDEEIRAAVVESDPTYAASPAASITAEDVSRWNEAYAWGHHSASGYLTAESDPVFAASTAASISAADVSNWSAAFAWGDHAAAGYLKSESDPSFSASPAAGITAADVTHWNAAFAWGDHARRVPDLGERSVVLLERRRGHLLDRRDPLERGVHLGRSRSGRLPHPGERPEDWRADEWRRAALGR
ncbi:MAG: hypothetical protein IRZ16_00610 [Myxococcaceae bacterium]|nr:hypothetical protein [Myxococcaceae bacterium]